MSCTQSTFRSPGAAAQCGGLPSEQTVPRMCSDSEHGTHAYESRTLNYTQMPSVRRNSGRAAKNPRALTSPCNSRTRRSTPCAAGCCGPKLMVKLEISFSATNSEVRACALTCQNGEQIHLQAPRSSYTVSGGSHSHEAEPRLNGAAHKAAR